MRLAFIFFALLFFSFPNKTLAVTVTINNPPSSVSTSEFTLNVTVSGAQEGTNYLRIDLFKDGTNNYFGETFNGSDWYKDSDGTKYSPITIVSGADWTGDIKGKVGNPNITEYDGQGSYKIRIRRYTGSGGQGGEDANASSVPISINVPTLTPTPTNTPTPAPTNTPTPNPTNTPTPSPTSIVTPTKKLAPTTKSEISPTYSQNSEVLAANSSQGQQAQGTNDFNLGGNLDDLEVKEQGYNWWKLLIIMGAVIVTGAVGVFLYNNHIKERSEELSQEN